MPKKIHGKPVDEEKWSKAKALAAEQGHAEEYDYIMGIYLRMVKKSGPILGKVLEKGRPAAALGTRKQQKQKRMKKGKAIYTWVWVKRTVRGWEYDGMVSPAERKAAQTVERREKRGQKVADISAQKKRELEAQRKAEGKQPSDKPTPAQIDAMPTKQKMYWDDPRVTKSRRELCNKTGILTLDDGAEKYIRDNLDTVFQTSDEQNAILKDMSIQTPLDTDGKAFDDPLFMEDALVNLKEMKKMLKDPGERIRRRNQALADRPNMPAYVAGSGQDWADKIEDAIDDVFDQYIEAIEKHENDKILCGKIAAYDKGIRAIKAVDGFDTMLVEEIFGEIPESRRSLDWDEVPEKYQELLLTMGIGEKQWTERRWGQEELKAFALAAVNDEFGRNVLEPWLELYGNIVHEDVDYTYTSSWSGDIDDTLRTLREASVAEEIPVSFEDELKPKLDKIRKTINPETLKFMNTMFAYRNIGVNMTKRKEFLAEQLKEHAEVRGNLFHHKQMGTKRDRPAYVYNRAEHSVHDFIDSAIYKASDINATEFGMKKNVTWRDFANGVKAMRRRKGFGNINVDMLDAISDVGKALGATSRAMTASKVNRTFYSLTRDMSEAGKNALKVPGEETIKDIVAPKLRDKGGYRSEGRSTANWGRHRQMDTAVSTNRKKGDQSLVQYQQFRKSSSKWKAGTVKKTRLPYNSPQAIKMPTKTKYMKSLATMDTRYGMSGRDSNAVSHVKLSILGTLGLNWGLKKLTKGDEIVPEFQWNPKLIPFGEKNPFSRYSFEVVEGSNWGGEQDTLGKTRYMDPKMFQGLAKEQYNNSLAEILGLSSGANVRAPQIVMQTSKKSIDEWKKEMVASWTHNQAGIRGTWRSDPDKAFTIHAAFDVMYHDYFPKWKKIEQAKGNVHYGWHGTGFKAAPHIIKGGYDRGGGLYGEGQYIAKSASKSLAYLRGGAGSWGRGSGTRGVMFWNRCAFGKTNDGTNPQAARRDPSIDTIFAAGRTGTNPRGASVTNLDHDEWCVKNRSAVIPISWIDVTLN